MAVAPRGGTRRRFLVPLVAVAITLAVLGVIGELATRASGILDRLNGYSRLIFVAEPAPGVPYGLRPGVETVYAGTPIRVNAGGCRGGERAGAAEVLVVGDSVVFGQGVSEEESVAGRLAQRLGTTTANCGVPGFELLAEAAQVARVAPLLRPRLIVAGMSLNDYDRAPRFHPLGVLTRDDAPAGGVLERSELLLLLRWVWTWARGGLWQQQAERAPSSGAGDATLRERLDALVATEHARFYAAPDPAAWARLEQGLAGLRDAATAAGAELVVAIFPESWQIGAAQPNREPQRRLLDACAAARVRCLDLAPAFAAAGGELFIDAQHPNARGHAVAADAIAAAVRPSS